LTDKIADRETEIGRDVDESNLLLLTDNQGGTCQNSEKLHSDIVTYSTLDTKLSINFDKLDEEPYELAAKQNWQNWQIKMIKKLNVLI